MGRRTANLGSKSNQLFSGKQAAIRAQDILCLLGLQMQWQETASNLSTLSSFIDINVTVRHVNVACVITAGEILLQS